jgi:hypothetical protein
VDVAANRFSLTGQSSGHTAFIMLPAILAVRIAAPAL